MKPINMCTLEVRIGKCNLNLKSDGYVGVSLEMGQNISSMSPIKRIQSRSIQFNTTLRMNVKKSLLQQSANPKCRILLHLIRQNREKKVIGIATVDIAMENNQGFKYHQFGQCADCQADIQISIMYGVDFQLGVRSEIGYFNSSQSQVLQNNLQQSRGMMSLAEDSILDNQDCHILKQSKAVSNIEPYSMVHAERRSTRLKSRRIRDIKKFRKAKPQNFGSCAPEEIINHYQTQIKTFEQQLIQREEWACGMKLLIQELEAENQLLKEITINEIEAQNIPNLEKGIEYVSKLVHSKFEASRSIIYESPKSQEKQRLESPEDDLKESQIMQQIDGSAQENGAETTRSIQQTKSYLQQTTSNKELSHDQISSRVQIQNSPQRQTKFGTLPVLQSREQLQNALKILTGQDRSLQVTQLKTKIAQLEELIFALKQQKQSLYDSTQELYSQLKNLQLQRDSLYKEIRLLETQLERMDQYIEQIKNENLKIKQQNQKYENNIKNEQFEKLNLQNQLLHEKCKELQRQLKESLKAIQDFKNDALNARSELITKQDQLNCYRLKYGDLGSMTDVFINNFHPKETNTRPSFDEKKTNGSGFLEFPKKLVQQTSTSSSDLHTLYNQFLQNSISERKFIQHSLSQIIGLKGSQLLTGSNSVIRQQSLKKLQTQINKMFINILKSSTEIKNLKQIEKAKVEVGRQIDQIISLN